MVCAGVGLGGEVVWEGGWSGWCGLGGGCGGPTPPFAPGTTRKRAIDDDANVEHQTQGYEGWFGHRFEACGVRVGI